MSRRYLRLKTREKGNTYKVGYEGRKGERSGVVFGAEGWDTVIHGRSWEGTGRMNGVERFLYRQLLEERGFLENTPGLGKI